MNKNNVLAVADVIESRRKFKSLGFNMECFVGKTKELYVEDKSGANCGTVACIAGWTRAVRSGKKPIPTSTSGSVVGFDYKPEADWLGLSEADGYDLFFAEDRYDLEDITPSQAVSVLRHLAETGEVDWSRALGEPGS